MILYFDTETGGLEGSHHAMLQIAWILERDDGTIIVERKFDVNPEGADMCLPAIDVNRFSIERMKAGLPFRAIMYYMTADLKDYPDAPIPCGHNVQFDISFFDAACKRENSSMFKFFNPKFYIDTRAIACFYHSIGLLDLENYKLETCAKHFNIPINAHDALEDVRATRTLFHTLKNMVKPC